jgi:trehalose 6-phosphate phosphatase
MDRFFLPHAANPPEPNADWALFLDLDGTLLDIAPAPDRVVVPPELIHDLGAASVALGGALAIVSGRMLGDVDTLLSPLRLPGGGEHGAVVRMPDGRCDEVDAEVPRRWIEILVEATTKMGGVVAERKNHSVVIHYRRAAQHEDSCRQLCNALVAGNEDEFEVLQCKMALEIRARRATKARPVERLMTVAPFLGRRPIFVGDDLTDEDGFRAATALGGDSLNVLARFGGRPKEVRRWLKSIARL